ncbi:bifunctional DNA primase/polymerase [Streptomyces albireticuli]|uniref:bifunctional DNA primase/polymerase n=1 Tax=Streptomyces albireticuli TaxID=1940 RepID=UPI0014747A40|nr:bifunctional DNA primase/polymerase [Streptomyces albireticuli]MCD9141469.1 bifunctional DNA primase/polymerase [Streptomyces albireticuli]MCD9164280.1 bifunctional DNA primase/polymerase [Streptomyces albireticuli]MCD9196401.1 bifunctional DNA primase/polymerase [Streptomyces albireticuli]
MPRLASADIDKVRRWFSGPHRDWNIAAPAITNRVIVLDYDPRDDVLKQDPLCSVERPMTAIEQLKRDAWAERHGRTVHTWEEADQALREFPCTLTATTPSGGNHLFFELDDTQFKDLEFGNKYEGCVDVKWRGYVLVGPSRTKRGSYLWHLPDWPDTPVPLPPAVRRVLLKKMPKPVPPPGGYRTRLDTKGGSPKAKARRVLASCCKRIAGLTDGRRTALRDKTYAMAGYVPCGCLTEAEIRTEMKAAAHACGYEQKAGSREVDRLIDDSIHSGSERPHPGHGHGRCR